MVDTNKRCFMASDYQGSVRAGRVTDAAEPPVSWSSRAVLHRPSEIEARVVHGLLDSLSLMSAIDANETALGDLSDRLLIQAAWPRLPELRRRRP